MRKREPAQRGFDLMVDGPELERFTGLSDRRHRQLADEGFVPQPQDGRWKLGESILGVFEYYRKSSDGSEKKRNQRLKNELLDIAVQAKRRELIPALEVRRFMAKMITGAKTRALSIPPSIAPKAALMTDPVAIEEMLFGAVRDLLTEMEKGEWSKPAPEDVKPAKKRR